MDDIDAMAKAQSAEMHAQKVKEMKAKHAITIAQSMGQHLASMAASTAETHRAISNIMSKMMTDMLADAMESMKYTQERLSRAASS
jgi:hypothetical protein